MQLFLSKTGGVKISDLFNVHISPIILALKALIGCVHLVDRTVIIPDQRYYITVSKHGMEIIRDKIEGI